MVKCYSNGHHVFLREPERLGLNYMNRVGGYSRWVLIQWRIQGRTPPPPHPVYFWTKLRPKGPKKVFFKTSPTFYLLVWVSRPHLI